jgi:hypothetical protein
LCCFSIFANDIHPKHQFYWNMRSYLLIIITPIDTTIKWSNAIHFYYNQYKITTQSPKSNVCHGRKKHCFSKHPTKYKPAVHPKKTESCMQCAVFKA